jgi:hypothetical protein
VTSPIQVTNVIRARVANHLYVNKTPYVDPNATASSQAYQRKDRFHYSWKPDKAEAHRIKRLSKGYLRAPD